MSGAAPIIYPCDSHQNVTYGSRSRASERVSFFYILNPLYHQVKPFYLSSETVLPIK
jgi:hypothetical protein